MRYFSMFTGVGGFELGIEYALETNKTKTKCLRKKSKEGLRIKKDSSKDEKLEGLGDSSKSRLRQQSDIGSIGQPLCIGFSEIDKYANQVLKYRFPNIKNYGDCKTINWSDVPDFDLLVGGSPCQDLSVAGKRAGITGERSGLFSEFIRALQEKKPKYFIWENVKGALSSNQGWDFAEVQTQMAEAGYSIWWQVLNAKDFGVPQNRERIFVVGTRGECGREVLFEAGSGGQNLRQIIGGSQGNRVYSSRGIATTIASQAGGLGAKTGLYEI
uniref:Putative methyltransferase n=1 Tax=viral metagenome TaxID=1070528 RepID=A0A6H1ZU23_9ZZZZ